MPICSLNEIETYSRRAARGVGITEATNSNTNLVLPKMNPLVIPWVIPWGLAEEAGSSTRYLAELGLPAVRTLLGFLASIERYSHCQPYSAMRPQSIADDEWRAQASAGDSHICPLVAACAVSDLGKLVLTRRLLIHQVLSPLLLLPLLLRAARYGALDYHVRWEGVEAQVLEDGIVMKTSKSYDLEHDLARAQTLQVFTRAKKQEDTSAVNDSKKGDRREIKRIVRYSLAHKGGAGITICDKDWSALQAYAARTYVPASEASRQRGAGASQDES